MSNMYYLLSLGFYIFFLWIFGLSELASPGSILVPHDTFYPVGDYLSSTVFGTFNSTLNFGNNLAALMVLMPDKFIIAALKLFFNNTLTQIIHIVLCLVIFHIVSFFSIKSIFRNAKLTSLLTLIYCFSPYASILYSAGIIYQISTVIALGLLPLILFKLMNFDPKTDAYLMMPLLALLGFGLLFIYPAIMLVILTAILLWKNERLAEFKGIFKSLLSRAQIISMVIIVIPFCFFLYLILNTGNDQASYLANSTSSAIQGGVFYPLMQISAWGLYNVWSPRSILSFHEYFFSNPYRILSIALVTTLLYFLYKKKKYTPLIFILFLAFFAKGSNPPLGDFFSLMINYAPFGYMIRSPDSKFGAFIAAWFVVVIFYLSPKQKLIALFLSSLFLITNLYGIFNHGAISSNRGDPSTSSFIYDPEIKKITSLINKYENFIVLGNYPVCAEEYYEEKFHTCHGLLYTNIRNQVVPSPGKNLEENIKKYEQFPILVLINKRQKNIIFNKYIDFSFFKFNKIYDSKNYEVYYKNSTNQFCTKQYVFSCVLKDESIIVSIPELAFRYYYPNQTYKLKDGLITLDLEPPKLEDHKQTYFLWTYALSYLLCLFFVFKVIFHRFMKVRN